jgi:transaldolase
MTLFLDSAFAEDARVAAEMGFVAGITTNPALVAKALGADPQIKSRADLLAGLCEVFPGTVMAQLTADTAEDREAEGLMLVNLRPGRIGLKIPCTPENFALAQRFAEEGYVVGMTAIFSAGQVCLACEAGAKYLFPYVNRSTRLLGDGVALVRQMRAMIDAMDAPTRILAASIKTPEEAVETLLAGAHGLTVPLDIIRAMGSHPLSERTIEEFARS